MDIAQALTIGVSVVNLLVVPIGAVKLSIALERRLTRIETKLNIPN
ncbi:hypothetical protein KTE13_18015 [Burkholderia multivorans]|nr:hypothetical protein [Burkholderia multivorans]MBU9401635.1 hypothetical protein [Burkholderia multivorans]